MTAAAQAHNAKIADVNARYAAAVSGEEKAAIRAEGTALNAKTLAAFKLVQDEFIGIEFSSDVVEKHVGYLDNVMILDAVLYALENGELFNEERTGALDVAWMLNALAEYGYYIFSPETADMQAVHVDKAQGNAKLWGSDKGYVYAQTSGATVSLLEKAYTGETDFTAEMAVYAAEREKQLDLMGETMNAEIAAMADFAKLLVD